MLHTKLCAHKVWMRCYSTQLARIEYNRLVTSKQLKPDEDQLRAVVKLQRLSETLLDYSPRDLPRIGQNRNDETRSPNDAMRSYAKGNKLVHVGGPNEYDAPKGLWIHGEVGTGKTMIMNLFFEFMPLARKKRVHFDAFMIALFGKIHAWNNRPRPYDLHVTHLVAREIVEESWLLCFDEFQITDVATALIMRQVLQEIFLMGGVVVATSNRAPQDLYKGGFHREHHSPFIELLAERCETMHLRGTKDYREVILNEQLVESSKETYFRCDINQEASAFNALVTSLVNGRQMTPRRLAVYDRELLVPMAGEGIAIYTFVELCEKARPADYLVLCQHYHSIVVKDIPVMDLSKKNEARRFIAFVDAAYENQVHLIISAASDPDGLFVANSAKVDIDIMHLDMIGTMLSATRNSSSDVTNLSLFTGEEEKFAFRRAVSRLKEMRAAVWSERHHRPQPVNFVKAGDKGRMLDDNMGGQDERRLRTSTDEFPVPGDDFGDEASYHGYLSMYQRFNPDEKPRDVLAEREADKPRFADRHFWSLGEWGVKAGEWGKGARAFWKGNDANCGKH
ncbi:AFG1-like ATPase-domain-containing protein [Gaertneriomyces semiglobifer]|nr:AFG1-like ATPase-domain-containing protein [Gaertneriomyces semiglobifer]